MSDYGDEILRKEELMQKRMEEILNRLKINPSQGGRLNQIIKVVSYSDKDRVVKNKGNSQRHKDLDQQEKD